MDTPYHIAIIMDGNGRWAKERNLPRNLGHRKGAERVKETVRLAKNAGVKVLTVFAFSTENWNRPKQEITFLFSYLVAFLKRYKDELVREDIRLQFIGRRDRIDRSIVQKMENLEKVTEGNASFIFNICLDYGGRWDIVNAVRHIAQSYKDDRIALEKINEETFHKNLSLNGIPDPDLLIRTSGEQRISNFLLWNLAYTELYFPKIFWPDFNEDEFNKVIKIYRQRERRFGAV